MEKRENQEEEEGKKIIKGSLVMLADDVSKRTKFLETRIWC